MEETGWEGSQAATLGTLFLDDSLNAHGVELQQQEEIQQLSEKNALSFRSRFQISCGVIGALFDWAVISRIAGAEVTVQAGPEFLEMQSEAEWPRVKLWRPVTESGT